MLDLQAETAKSALSKTARAAARNLFRLADPRAWTEDYPWKSTGIAAVAGFFVAARGSSPAAESSGPSPASEAPAKGPSPWDLMTSLLLSTGTDAVKSVLTPWLAEKVQAALQAREAAKAPEEAQTPTEDPA